MRARAGAVPSTRPSAATRAPTRGASARASGCGSANHTSIPVGIVADETAEWMRLSVSRAVPRSSQAADAPPSSAASASRSSRPGSSHAPASTSSDPMETSRRTAAVASKPGSAGEPGALAASGGAVASGVVAGAETPSAAAITPVITSAGTELACSKMRHSRSMPSAAYALSPPSSCTWCSPLTTSTAPRSTTRGQIAATSAADNGRSEWKALIAGSTETGSAPAWCSTDDTVMASSATAQVRVTSPKSISPSGIRVPRSAVQTTLSSVRSRCTACCGRSDATASSCAQAAAAASVTSRRLARSG